MIRVPFVKDGVCLLGCGRCVRVEGLRERASGMARMLYFDDGVVGVEWGDLGLEGEVGGSGVCAEDVEDRKVSE